MVLSSRNPNMGKENHFQETFFKYCCHLHLFAPHVANERKTRTFKDKAGRYYSPEGNALKRKGVISGMPDTLLFHPYMDPDIGFRCGVAVELKVDGGELSDNQKKILDLLYDLGWMSIVTFGPDIYTWMETVYLPNIINMTKSKIEVHAK